MSDVRASFLTGMRADAVGGRRRWTPALFLLFATALEPAQGVTAPAVAIPQFARVEYPADLAGLPPSERAALAKIVKAGRIMDALYMRQVWPGTAAEVARLASARGQASRPELDALLFLKGPWLPSGEPFLPGVPAVRPPGDFYPPDSGKAEIEAWLKGLPAPERERALSPVTAVRRGPDGQLVTVPYSMSYGGELNEAVRLLKEAAELTHEPTLRRFLDERARAFSSNDYFASDLAFVDLRGPIDAVIGPYEPDDDSWFEAKTAFEACLGVVNDAATRRVAALASYRQELEDHLPLAPALRGRKLQGGSPILVLDAVYQGGQCGAGSAIAGYGLPNDIRVLQAKGARTVVYRNVLAVRYERIHRPIASALLNPGDLAALQADDILDEILFVRMFDGLGPLTVQGTDRPIAEALGATAVVAGQIRSMLLSLWAHRYLLDRGYLHGKDARSLYSAFAVPALARLQTGLGSSASQGSTYVLNRLLDSRAFEVDASHHLVIDPQRARDTVASAASEFVALLAAGDVAAVRKVLERYVGVRPEVRAILERMGPLPPRDIPVFADVDISSKNR